MDKSKRIIGFDLARVVAIFVVIGIYHNLGYTGLYHNEPSIRVLVYSCLGVFTFLSAFLLSSKYVFDSKEKIVGFYKKRVLRIWPLFVASSLMLFVLKFNAFVPTIKGIFGISPFWAPHPTTMWYVAMLISLYTITPFVLRTNKLISQCLRAFGVMAVVGLIQIVFGTVVPRTFNYFTVYLIGLILGSHYSDSTLATLKSKKTLIISFVWIALIFVVYYTKNVYLKSIDSVIGIVAVLNLSLIVSEFFKENSLYVKWVSILSYSSFCAYLFHREIIWAMFRIYHPDSFWPIFFEVLLIGVPVSFLCAYYIQKVYDAIIDRIVK